MWIQASQVMVKGMRQKNAPSSSQSRCYGFRVARRRSVFRF